MKQKRSKLSAPNPNDISGSGGKSASTAQSPRLTDSFTTSGQVKAVAVLSAGPVEGLVNGDQSIMLDSTPYANADGSKNFEDVSWQVTDGAADQDVLSGDGFNQIERGVAIGQILQPSQAVIRTGTGDAARLTLRFPKGLIQRSDTGYYPAGIRLRIERRAAPDGQWQKVYERDINKKQASPFEMEIKVKAPAAISDAISSDQPRWSIRITRLTLARDSLTVNDQVQWGLVTWVIYDQLTYAGVSMLALQAGSQGISGRLPRLSVALKGRLVRLPSNYDVASRRYTGIWDGRFRIAWTSNPAWVLFDLLTDKNWGLGLSLDAINRYDFYALARYSDGMVSNGHGGQEPRYRFDGVIRNRETAAQLVARICAGYRAILFWSAGQLRCVFDQPQEISLWLTNAYVEQGRFVYSMAPRQSWFSHVAVSFDAASDAVSEQGVGVEVETSPRLLERHGFRQKDLRLIGCRRRSEAKRHARWMLETAEAGLHSISWRASLDHFADHPVRPGDVIAIYDEHRIGRDTVPIRMIVTENKVLTHHAVARQFVASTRLNMRYQTLSGWANAAVTVTDHNQDAMSGAIITPVDESGWSEENAPLAHGIGIIHNAAENGAAENNANMAKAALYKVVSLRETGRFQVEVDAVRHDPSKYARIDTAATAAPVVQTRLNFGADLPLAEGLMWRQLADGTGRDIYISWTPPKDARLAQWQITAEDANINQRQHRVTETNALLRDMPAGAWKITVRGIDWLGRVGRGTAVNIVVRADALTPTRPTAVKVISGYQQLALTWALPDQFRDASVEIWEYPSAANSGGQLVDTIRGLSWISLARSVGNMAWFRLRCRLSGGTLSPFTRVVSGAALALPQPPAAQDGRDGTDGRDGMRGTIITALAVSAASWRNQDALAALRLLVVGAPVNGDLVTLYRKGASTRGVSSWSETRRYTDTAWAKPDAVLSGDQLTETSVPASKLKLDDTALVSDPASHALTIGQLNASRITSGHLSSNSYIAGEKGFQIDMTGAAEFNEATIRGVLIGGRVESATLVSSQITIPTEAGKPYLTLENNRPIGFKYRYVDNQSLIIGPLIVQQDQASLRLGDARKLILSCDDPFQDSEGAAINPYFTRFWAYRPAMQIKTSMTRSATSAGHPWGQHINTGRVRVRVETNNGDKIAESNIFDLASDSRWQNSRQDASWLGILSARDGFSHGSIVTVSRTVTHHADGNRHYTSGLAVDIRLGISFSWKSTWPKGSGLRLKILLDYQNTSINFNIINALFYKITIRGKTIDG